MAGQCLCNDADNDLVCDPASTQRSDGIDNDGDGGIDFDPDPQLGDRQCVAAFDGREGGSCGLGVEVAP